MSQLESEIQNDILDYLNRAGVFSFRTNSVGIYDKEKGVYRTPSKYSMKGMSDIIGVRASDGKIVCIEIKNSVGKLSIHQKAFLNKINRCGGIAFCARSVEQVIEELISTERRVYL